MTKDIEIFEDFLPSTDLELLLKEIKKVWEDEDYLCRTSYNYWNSDIIRDSAMVIIHDFKKGSKVHDLINKACNEQLNMPAPEQIQMHNFPPFSYIPWHTDRHVDNAATLYLNEEWNKNWGGAYLYKDNTGGVGALYPTSNRLLLQYNGIEHSTTMTTSSAPLRTTIQMFFRD